MTGFARQQISNGEMTIEVDLRSVNHRYLELGCRLPREYSAYESIIRNQISDVLKRGKVDCTINRKSTSKFSEELPSPARISLYMRAYSDYARDFGIQEDRRADLLKDLLLRREPAGSIDNELQEGEREVVVDLVKRALVDLVGMRRLEGKKLVDDILQRLEELRALHKKIEENVEFAPENLRKRILDRLARLSPEVTIDPIRLATEAAIAAEKVDVSEEIVRLKSHFEQISSAITEPPSGRKVDFLIQECVREFNTIGSKAQDARIQTLVVEGKVALEKMREQVQNLE